jgi:hypothetical protein
MIPYKNRKCYINDGEGYSPLRYENRISIRLRVSPDVRRVLEVRRSLGEPQRVDLTLKSLSINGRDINLNNVSSYAGPEFDGGISIGDHKFKGGNSLRSFKSGEEIKAVFSIHGTFGEERGLAVARVFEYTVPSSTKDDAGNPSATTPL